MKLFGSFSSVFHNFCLLSITLKCGQSESTRRGGLSELECRDIGFNADNLLCESCDLLNGYELSEIRANCSKCCNEVSTEEKQSFASLGLAKKYPRAVLEVCNCKMGVLPHLSDFLKSDKREKYRNLIQHHANGAWPSIMLINEDGSVDKTFSITKWNGETITEFLDTYLVN